MGLFVFIVALVMLFVVARWAARRMRIKERVQVSVQRTKERFAKLKRIVIKVFKIAAVCFVGVSAISIGYFYSLSDAEREELHRKLAEQRQVETVKKERERQMARKKQEDGSTERLGAEQESPPVSPYQTEREENIYRAYKGLKMDERDFNVGGYCLNEEKKGTMTFEQCLGLSVIKLVGNK